MARHVTVSTIAADLVWIERAGKRASQAAVDQMIAYWREQLEHVLPDRPDLIVLPECCDAYPALSAEESSAYYAARGDQILDFFAETARRNRCYIAYSALRQDDRGRWFNSTRILDRTGRVAGLYDKNNPTPDEIEERGIVPGTEASVIACDFGRVACAICFDLHFDELRQRYAEARPAPDLILFASMFHGGFMQRYWAYSCRAHFVAALHVKHPSPILSPIGEELASTTLVHFNHATATLNLDCRVVHFDNHRGPILRMKEKYGRGIRVRDTDNGFLDSVLISSEMEAVSVDEALAEFGIEPWDAVLERHRVRRTSPR